MTLEEQRWSQFFAAFIIVAFRFASECASLPNLLAIKRFARSVVVEIIICDDTDIGQIVAEVALL